MIPALRHLKPHEDFMRIETGIPMDDWRAVGPAARAAEESRCIPPLDIEGAADVPGGEGGARVGVAAERTLLDATVLVPRPGNTPVVELQDLLLALEQLLVELEVLVGGRPAVPVEGLDLAGGDGRRRAVFL